MPENLKEFSLLGSSALKLSERASAQQSTAGKKARSKVPNKNYNADLTFSNMPTKIPQVKPQKGYVGREQKTVSGSIQLQFEG